MPLHRIRKPFNLNLYFFDVYVYENENNFLLETEVTFSSSSTMPLIRHIYVNFDENFEVVYFYSQLQNFHQHSQKFYQQCHVII